MKKRGKAKKTRAQIELSFQFLFAVILVAVVVFVAIWGIRQFMLRTEQMKIGTFIQDLKDEILNLWEATEAADEEKTFAFSTKFSYVCFVSSECNDDQLPNELQGQGLCNEFKDYEGKNFFLVGKIREDEPIFKALEVAEKYGLSSVWLIDCYGKECISLPKSPLCIPVKNGKVKLRLYKGSDYGCTELNKVCIDASAMN